MTSLPDPNKNLTVLENFDFCAFLYETAQSNDYCAKPKKSTSLVMKSKLVTKRTYPWTAAFLATEKFSQEEFKCGGSLSRFPLNFPHLLTYFLLDQ